MAETRDREVFWEGLSIANYQTNSFIGEAGANWSGYSFTASFTPLRSINPNSATDAERGRFLATLAMDLLKPRT